VHPTGRLCREVSKRQFVCTLTLAEQDVQLGNRKRMGEEHASRRPWGTWTAGQLVRIHIRAKQRQCSLSGDAEAVDVCGAAGPCSAYGTPVQGRHQAVLDQPSQHTAAGAFAAARSLVVEMEAAQMVAGEDTYARQVEQDGSVPDR